jgi:hypothetical protein
MPTPFLSLFQYGYRRAEVGLRCVVGLDDERVLFEDVLDDPALHADAATVNQADRAEAGVVRGADVLVYDGRNIGRSECVEVERLLDRNVRRGVVVTVPVARNEPSLPS